MNKILLLITLLSFSLYAEDGRTVPSSVTNQQLTDSQRMVLNDYLTYLDTLPPKIHIPNIKQGQISYFKLFKKIFNMHGMKFSTENNTKEWNNLFANNAKKFILVYGERFPDAIPILTDKNNLENIQYIGDFAKEYSYDSGNVCIGAGAG